MLPSDFHHRRWSMILSIPTGQRRNATRNGTDHRNNLRISPTSSTTVSILSIERSLIQLSKPLHFIWWTTRHRSSFIPQVRFFFHEAMHSISLSLSLSRSSREWSIQEDQARISASEHLSVSSISFVQSLVSTGDCLSHSVVALQSIVSAFVWSRSDIVVVVGTTSTSHDFHARTTGRSGIGVRQKSLSRYLLSWRISPAD